ncbi:hypothetical protein CWT12_12390 [Actinomyces sp. 432]|uniref:hypothetical protein n=1 Tax=Actinomyces sp. 432 TaxID=2057798 RepID=UPI0013746392|nr:hypothetical protein [Actinomyces sp. 432]QHO91950.1 hypothetical protein CWT12_12390 [Actinomyces sp. 432]
MSAPIGSPSYWAAIQVLAADYTRDLRTRHCGEVWEYYPEIHETAAYQLTDSLAREGGRPTPAEVEWAVQQLAADPDAEVES